MAFEGLNKYVWSTVVVPGMDNNFAEFRNERESRFLCQLVDAGRVWALPGINTFCNEQQGVRLLSSLARLR